MLCASSLMQRQVQNWMVPSRFLSRLILFLTWARCPPVLNALPLLFSLYRISLDTYSSTLFPLPAKSSFPTASAARSAGEIHALQKRRALAGGWIRGVATLLNWFASTEGNDTNAAISDSLWKTFEEVERGDLYRDGPNDGWTGILDSIVSGAVERLGGLSSAVEDGPDAKREALLGLLSTAMRLSYGSIEPYLPTILVSLAATASTEIPSKSTSAFLSALLIHHTRSLLLPSLLLLLSSALASSSAVVNNLLTTHHWNDELSLALKGMVGITVAGCWDNLIAELQDEIRPGEDSSIDGSVAAQVDDRSRSTKRRKTIAVESPSIESPKIKSIAARITLLSLVVRSIPSPIPISHFATFLTALSAPAIAQLIQGDTTKGGREMLEVRYRIIERMRLEGLEESSEMILDDATIARMITMVATSMDGYTVIEMVGRVPDSIITTRLIACLVIR